MGPTWWGQSGADRTQVGPMLAPWTLLSGNIWKTKAGIELRPVQKLVSIGAFSKWRHFVDTTLHFLEIKFWCFDSNATDVLSKVPTYRSSYYLNQIWESLRPHTCITRRSMPLMSCPRFLLTDQVITWTKYGRIYGHIHASPSFNVLWVWKYWSKHHWTYKHWYIYCQ